MKAMRQIDPWAQVVALGDVRFGILVGGPFDGRCYPLAHGTPTTLHVSGEGAEAGGTLRYVLRDGLYRYDGSEVPASAA